MFRVECEVRVVDCCVRVVEGCVRVVEGCACEDVGPRVVAREVRGVLVMLVTWPL